MANAIQNFFSKIISPTSVLGQAWGMTPATGQAGTASQASVTQASPAMQQAVYQGLKATGPAGPKEPIPGQSGTLATAPATGDRVVGKAPAPWETSKLGKSSWYSGYGQSYNPNLSPVKWGYDTVFQGKDPTLYPKLNGVDWGKVQIPYWNKDTNQVPLLVTKDEHGNRIVQFANPEYMRQGPLKTPDPVAYQALWDKINDLPFERAPRDLIGKYYDAFNPYKAEGKRSTWTPSDQSAWDNWVANSQDPGGISTLWKNFTGSAGYSDPPFMGGQFENVTAGDTFENVSNRYGKDIATALAAQGFIANPADGSSVFYQEPVPPGVGTPNEDLSVDTMAKLMEMLGAGGLFGSQFGSYGANNQDLMSVLMSALQGNNSNQEVQPIVRPTNEQPAMTTTKFY